MEREREEEQKRQAQQRKQPQPKPQEKPQQDKQPKSDQDTQNAQQKRTERLPPDQGGELSAEAARAGRWGQLPSKLHQDAKNAHQQPPPGRWRRLIERYRERISRQ